MKRKQEDETSWWFYFDLVHNKAKAKCKNCGKVLDRDERFSTSGMKYHLKQYHPALYSKKLEAVNCKRQKEEEQKKSVVDPKEFFKPRISDAPKSANQPDIQRALGLWDKQGSSTLKIDRLIMEMICVDLMPMSTVEKSGFRRLLNFTVPKYNIKSRWFFTESELPKLFNDCFLRIKSDLQKASSISFTTDAWASKDQSHSLLALSCHYIDENYQPRFAILGASPIAGRHTGDNFCQLLLDVLNQFTIASDKVHLFLRDAAASMKRTTKLMNVTSFDCFAHKLQLSVKDGLDKIDGFKSISEKCKKIVKRIRKSDISRDEFKSLQEMCELPKRLLQKDVEIRWNSTYKMFFSFVQNRQAVSLLSQQADVYPAFDAIEWSIMESIIDMLKPVYLSTMELQNRRTTIASVIPMYQTVLFKLRQPQTNSLFLTASRNAIISGLESRMIGWGDNKYLVLSTLLDPRYKMKFFPKENYDRYRNWLEIEAESNAVSSRDYASMMNEFMESQKEANDVCIADLPPSSDLKMKARMMKRKQEDETSWWFYFDLVHNKAKAKCKNCGKVLDRDERFSTSGMKYHLKQYHPALYSKKLEAVNCKRQKEEEQKKSVVDPKEFFKPRISDAPKSANQPDIQRALGLWDKQGSSTLKIDRLIMEMICVDLMPMSTVEKSGFRRLLNFTVPKYNIKSRWFFTESELPKLFNDCFLRIKSDLQKASSISFTTDAWASKDQSHSLLALSCHYIDENYQPRFAILGASPIAGRHTGDNFCQLLLDVLNQFTIASDKVHLFLRDAAASMKRTTKLMNVTSFDCFAHKLQLSVKDGLDKIDGFKSISEKCKKIVKRIRKSDISRDEFKSLQEMCELPKRLLQKDVEIRWNSTYKMFFSFVQNRQAVSLLSQQADVYPAFDAIEWSIMESIIDMLKPVYLSTMELQNRRTTIASVIPMYQTVLFKLRQPRTNSLFLTASRNAIISGLESRMIGWGDNKYLVLSTLLDPRYKMKFFPKENYDRYRNWLEIEAESNAVLSCGETNISHVPPKSVPQGDYASMMNEFMESQKEANDVCIADLPPSSDLKMKARMALVMTDSNVIQEAKQPRKLNSYTAAYKLEAIKHAKQTSVHSASQKFHVDRNTIRAWIKNEMKLHIIKESSPAGKFKKNVPGAGRPLKFRDLDKKLAFWVRERRKQELRVSRHIIQQQAERTFNAEADNEDFKVFFIFLLLFGLI
uniref:BED-type domain-containing protein n=2 Tax=Ditylenchus dipsaci TaxID=166011 RepID=A0A915DP06_9BILA